jgi:acetyl esterase/lipase
MLSWQAKLSRITGPIFLTYFFLKIHFKVKFGKKHWLYYVRQEIAKLAQPPKQAITQPIKTDKINALLVNYQPEKSNQIMLFLHGGAYILGTPRFYTELVYHIAQSSHMDVFLLDYRLAPEHQFPSAIDDAIKAYEYLINTGYKPENIIIAGDSAGGGLTIATLISLRDKKLALPKCAICIAPFFDFTFSGASIQKNNKKDYMLRITEKAKTDLINMYLKDTDIKNPLVSPIFADLTGLPPIFIQVGGCDVLLDDSLRFAEKAKKEQVNITLEVWQEMPHDFHLLVRVLPEAKRAINRIGEYLLSIH